MNARAAIALFALLVSPRVAGAAAAATEACPPPDDPASGPLAGGIGPADFGTVPEACGATDAALRLRATLLMASTSPDDRRSFVGTTTLRGRYQLGARSTLSAAADVFTYWHIDNGGLTSKGASFGPATVAFHQTVLAGAQAATALYARVLLPLDSARDNGVETGVELGGAFRARAGSRVIIDGGLALAAPADIIAGQTHLYLHPLALAEAWVRLGAWAALAAGLDARVAAAPAWDLITLAPRLAARFALKRRFWAAILLELPVAGSDRTDLIGGLFAGFTPN